MRVDYYEWNLQVTSEGFNDLLALACTQTAGIDKDTGKLIAYCAMYE